MDNRKQQDRRRQEDIALHRGLFWVGAAVILEGLISLLHKYYINYTISEPAVELAYTLHNILKGIRLAGPVLAIACGVWMALQFRKGGRYAPAGVAALGIGALSICAHVAMRFQGAGVQMLLLLVPAWAGLALVYYLYQREFFLGAVASGLSVLGLWFVRYGTGFSTETGLILLAIALVGGAALWLKKSGGSLKRGDGREQVLPANASYPMIFASCLLSFGVLVLALLLGGTMAYYLIFVMLAWLFALLVYYTVKLM